MVSGRKFHLTVTDTEQLGEKLFKDHLVGSIGKRLVRGIPGVGGREVLNKQREEQFCLVGLGKKGKEIKGKWHMANGCAASQR